MTTLSKTFTSATTSTALYLAVGQTCAYALSGTFVATIALERTLNGGQTWEPLVTLTAATPSSNLVLSAGTYRFRCTSYTSGSAVATLVADVQPLLQRTAPDGTTVLLVDANGLESPIIGGTPTGKLTYDPGSCAVNTLRVASNVVSAETVTIGADVFEVEIVNTDSTDTTQAADSLNNTTNPITLATFTTSYPHITIAVGGLIRVENEILRCVSTVGGSRTFARGVSGTTTAAHANGVAVYKGDGIAGGSTVAVGLVTTLTPTAFTAALIADSNAVGTQSITLSAVSANEVLAVANAVGVNTTATTETLAGVNNVWNSTTMLGGRAQAVKKLAIQTRVPVTQEVTLGHLQCQFDFTPTFVQVFAVVTATPSVALAWDGGITIASGLVTLDNAGSTDWATTHTLTIVAMA